MAILKSLSILTLALVCNSIGANQETWNIFDMIYIFHPESMCNDSFYNRLKQCDADMDLSVNKIHYFLVKLFVLKNV